MYWSRGIDCFCVIELNLFITILIVSVLVLPLLNLINTTQYGFFIAWIIYLPCNWLLCCFLKIILQRICVWRYCSFIRKNNLFHLCTRVNLHKSSIMQKTIQFLVVKFGCFCDVIWILFFLCYENHDTGTVNWILLALFTALQFFSKICFYSFFPNISITNHLFLGSSLPLIFLSENGFLIYWNDKYRKLRRFLLTCTNKLCDTNPSNILKEVFNTHHSEIYDLGWHQTNINSHSWNI